MGTASYSVGVYGQKLGTGTTLAGHVKTSGAFTTSTAAANVEDAEGDIALSVGDLFQCHADVDMRVNFGGAAASATIGHFIPAGAQKEFECTEAGPVSIVDVA